MSEFSNRFGREPEVVAEAPGRVNLIGEHTDYNDGYVLPIAIPQRTRIELAGRSDRLVLVTSDELEPSQIRGYELGGERPGGGWLDYVQGITWVLAQVGRAGRGFEARISSGVPVGSGLSSSAALEVGLLRALRQAWQLELTDVELARLAQRAENDFVGARVGLMDQLAASLAEPDTALFIDIRTLEYRRLALPAGAELLVVDSGVSHALAGGEYNRRRSECEQACSLLGVSSLRDLSPSDLDRVAALPDPLNRRALHVYHENSRVLEAVTAILTGDLALLGWLLAASHESLRVDYEVSIAELDLLVELAQAEPTVYGARMTGGGFGGSIVALARRGSAAAVGRRITEAYAKRTGRTATVLVPPGGGRAGAGRRRNAAKSDARSGT